ncbi:MAG TPA: PDZ domain-containing protein [Chitinophagaceae bacterium]|jgi:serine protease Do
MKQYFLKLSAASLLLGLTALSASAQQDENDMKPAKKAGKSDLVIIKTNDGKDAKVTVEVKGGEVTVNGKPLSEFKDDNITITRRKQVEGMGAVFMPNSRFRVNRDDAFNLNNENLLRAYSYSDGGNKGFLGVTTEMEGDRNGAVIRTVTDSGAAKKAGLKEGDVIIRIDDQKISNPDDLSKAVGKHKPAEKVTVVYKRDGKEQTQSIVLGKRQEYAYSFNNNFNFNGDLVVRGHSRLGIKAQETEEGKGVKVLDVDDDSPSAKAGIKENDIITEFDGTEVNDVDKLREAALRTVGKTSFNVKLIRDGKSQEITIKIPKNLKTTNL